MLRNRIFSYLTLGILMSLPAFGSSLSFTSIQYNSSSLCSGTCSFGITFGWAAVNDNNVVATSFAATSSNYFGYTYQNGVYSAPIQNGGKSTSFAGIDNSGEFSGFFSPSGTFSGFTNSGSFTTQNMPSNTVFTDGTPNPFNSGTVVGTFFNGLEENGGSNSPGVGFFLNSGQLTRGFVYNPANATPYSPVLCTASATTTNPYSINDSGQVVGYCKTSSGGLQQAFVYNSNTPNTAPTILSSASLGTALGDTIGGVFLTSVDDSGDLAGYYSGGASGQFNGFYCAGNYTFSNCSVINVPQVAAFNQAATINGTEIMGMNNVGSLVGVYTETDGSTHTFLATTPTIVATAPEPSTVLLALVPMLGVAAFRRRRNNAVRS